MLLEKAHSNIKLQENKQLRWKVHHFVTQGGEESSQKIISRKGKLLFFLDKYSPLVLPVAYMELSSADSMDVVLKLILRSLAFPCSAVDWRDECDEKLQCDSHNMDPWTRKH